MNILQHGVTPSTRTWLVWSPSAACLVVSAPIRVVSSRFPIYMLPFHCCLNFVLYGPFSNYPCFCAYLCCIGTWHCASNTRSWLFTWFGTYALCNKQCQLTALVFRCSLTQSRFCTTCSVCLYGCSAPYIRIRSYQRPLYRTR